MSDEIDRETTTRKVTSDPNSSVDGYRVSEHSSRVSNDNSATGLILGVLLALVAGIGASVYFYNNRPSSTIVVPGATNTVKDNKSTVIERSTTKEVQPATPPVVPNIEVNIPTPPSVPPTTTQTEPVTPVPSTGN